MGRMSAKVSSVRTGGSAGRQNSLNLPGAGLVRILNALDAADQKGGKHARRVAARQPFRVDSIPVALVHRDGTQSEFLAAGRNLSRGGISILHNAFVHPGTPCRVTLNHLKRGAVQIRGEVARCQHRVSVIHEVGIRFAEPIRLRDYVSPDPFANVFTLEQVDPSTLRGQVLCVEGNPMELELIRQFLKPTSIQLVSSTSLEGLGEGLESCEAALVSADLPGLSPAQVLQRVRDLGVLGPVVMMTPDAGPATRTRIEGVRAQAFLARPLSQDVLLRALAEWILVEKSAWAAFKGQGGPAAPEGGCEDFAACGEGLQAALDGKDERQVRSACARLVQVAEVLGCQSVGAMADAILKALSAGQDLGGLESQVRVLASTCLAARAVGGAKAAA